MGTPTSNQILFVELLSMAGEIAVRDDIRGSVVAMTLDECVKAGWVVVTRFSTGFNKVAVTDKGRLFIKEDLN